MAKILDHGLMSRWQRVYIPQPKKSGTLRRASSITLYQTQGMFYALAGLLTLSTVTLLGEAAVHKIFLNQNPALAS